MKKVASYFSMPPRLKDWVKMASGAFLILLVIGFGIGWFKPEVAERIADLFASYLTDEGIGESVGLAFAKLLLINNLSAAFSSLSFGMIPFLYLPAMSLGSNSLMVGLFAAYYCRGGMGRVYLAGILPHGIFELTALCIACACGLWICENFSDRLRRREGTVSFRQSVHDAMLIFLRIVAPLLILAALIESFITPQVMAHFMN